MINNENKNIINDDTDFALVMSLAIPFDEAYSQIITPIERPDPSPLPPIQSSAEDTSKTVCGTTYSNETLEGYDIGYDDTAKVSNWKITNDWLYGFDLGTTDREHGEPHRFEDVPYDEGTEPEEEFRKPTPKPKPGDPTPNCITLPPPTLTGNMGGTDTGDPGFFGDDIRIDKVYPEWHDTRKTTFELYVGMDPVILSRDVQSGSTFFQWMLREWD